MAFQSKENKQKIYIFSSDSKLGRRGLEIIEALDNSIRSIDINKEALSSMVWLEIASMLKVDLKNVINQYHKVIVNNYDTNDFVVADWLEIINRNPSVLEYPITINGSKALKISNKKDIFNFYSELSERKKSYKIIEINNQNNIRGLTTAI